MPTMTAERGVEPWRRRLLLPAYRLADAARYTGATSQVISNWHFRDMGEGRVALPGREHRRGLSYLELIEAAIVAVFRKVGVSLGSIARTREYMAQNFNSEYPFTEYRFKSDGYHLLMDLQEFEPDLKLRGWIVADEGGQLGWESMMADRLLEFDYDKNLDLAISWHVAGRDSPVLIDPRVAFGAPMVRGVPTWILKGRWIAGESVADIHEDFGLSEEEIEHGLRFEGIQVELDTFLRQRRRDSFAESAQSIKTTNAR